MNRWREEGGRARESGRGEWKEGVCVFVCEREIERERRARDVQGESLAER